VKAAPRNSAGGPRRCALALCAAGQFHAAGLLDEIIVQVGSVRRPAAKLLKNPASPTWRL